MGHDTRSPSVAAAEDCKQLIKHQLGSNTSSSSSSSSSCLRGTYASQLSAMFGVPCFVAGSSTRDLDHEEYLRRI
jgi:hypothetical protein